MTSQLVIFRAFFSFFSSPEKNSRKSTHEKIWPKRRKIVIYIKLFELAILHKNGSQTDHKLVFLSDIPKYTKPLGDFDYVQHGQSIALQCCSEGVRDINWYRLDGDNWMPFPPSTTGQSDVPQLQEQKQILRIYHATFQDNTTFRCDLIPKRQPGVVPQGAIISHKIWLHVVGE